MHILVFWEKCGKFSFAIFTSIFFVNFNLTVFFLFWKINLFQRNFNTQLRLSQFIFKYFENNFGLVQFAPRQIITQQFIQNYNLHIMIYTVLR